MLYSTQTTCLTHSSDPHLYQRILSHDTCRSPTRSRGRVALSKEPNWAQCLNSLGTLQSKPKEPTSSSPDNSWLRISVTATKLPMRVVVRLKLWITMSRSTAITLQIVKAKKTKGRIFTKTETSRTRRSGWAMNTALFQRSSPISETWKVFWPTTSKPKCPMKVSERAQCLFLSPDLRGPQPSITSLQSTLSPVKALVWSTDRAWEFLKPHQIVRITKMPNWCMGVMGTLCLPPKSSRALKDKRGKTKWRLTLLGSSKTCEICKINSRRLPTKPNRSRKSTRSCLSRCKYSREVA